MQWKHKCKLDWLIERHNYLSASEVMALVPVTKTGRPRKVTDLDYLKVYANKLTELTEEDCWSYNEMARGHLLEPYAIKSFNELGLDELFHWDDRIVASGIPGSLAFSPDALDVPMGEERAIVKATSIGEVKSYNASRHFTTAQMPRGEIEERWQIATAMAVANKIDDGYLILYNPNVIKRYQLYVVEFDRMSLENEIEMILEVEDKWKDFIASMPCDVSKVDGRFFGPSVDSFEDIVEEIEQRQRLNP